MISDASLHGATCIVMLHPEANVRNQTPVVLGDRALHLTRRRGFKKIKTKTNPSTTRRIGPWISHPIPYVAMNRTKGRDSTLISLKGMRREFRSLESKPRMRAAWRKLRLVAARAFIAARWGSGERASERERKREMGNQSRGEGKGKTYVGNPIAEEKRQLTSSSVPFLPMGVETGQRRWLRRRWNWKRRCKVLEDCDFVI